MNKILFFGLCTFALSCAHAETPSPSTQPPSKTAPDLKLQPLKPPQDIRVDLQREEVVIHEDQTYESLLTHEKTLLTTLGLLTHQTVDSPSYFPGHTSVELVEAYTLQPDGTKIHVPKDNLFTTTSPADPSAPGFVTSLQQHVAFPHLKIGSTLHVKWLYKQLDAPLFNFADAISPSFEIDSLRTEMSVNLPKAMYVKWAKSGDFQVKDTIEGDRHIISAVLGPQSGHKHELFMPASSDLIPFFEVSTIQSWEEIGKRISQLTLPSQTLTPEIEKLAKTIVGNAVGKEAVRAIYNWTANNIAYLETAINPRQGIVPPSASEIIANRFGDCKAHSCVLQTLLKVLGIESYPAVINWDNSLKQYPLPIVNFDHEMVFVPSLNLFLNPTDGYSTFNTPLEETNFSSQGLQVLADKPVLIVKPQGSVLTKTPAGLAENNQYLITGHMQMNIHGDVQVKGQVKTTGCFADLLRGALVQEGSVDRFINTRLLNNGIKGNVVATTPNISDLDAPMNIEYAWNGLQAVQHFEEELLFQVPIAVDVFTSHFFMQFLSLSSPRQYPLIIGATTYQWDFTIDLPLDYQIGKHPLDVDIKSPQGSYTAAYTVYNGALHIKRVLTLNHNVYPAVAYANVADLLMALIKDRNSIFSFVPIPVKEFPGLRNK